ncbi:MAG: PorP/SprF family type IX secretion system membrane protein [Chryseolinea sp.]
MSEFKIERLSDVQNENSVDKLNVRVIGVMKTLLIVFSVLSISYNAARAQAPGPFYRQFSFNPYLLNPAYVAINNNIEASMVYRKQLANFKDAPSTAGASLQLPMSDRVAIGFNVYTDKQVLLSNSNFKATFGYIIPIAKNQTLRFGLSGGVGMNKLNLSVDEMNTQDPVITRSVGTNYYIDGNFGAVYTNRGLRVGFALTDLFRSSAFNAESFNKFKMSNLKNRLVSASYRFDVGMMKDWSIEPYALFRQTTDGAQNYWELATLAYYKQNIWSGVSYNKNKGIGLIVGANVKEMFRFSYSYEFAPFGSKIASGGAHELHLGIRLPSKKVHIYAKNSQQTSKKRVLANERPAADKKVPNSTQEMVLEDNATVETEKHQQRLSEDPLVITREKAPKTTTGKPSTTTETGSTTVAKSNTEKTTPKKTVAAAKEAFTMTKGHNYVVVGAFRQMAGSMKYVKEVRERGYRPSVALNPKNNLYYVYIFSSKELDDVRKKRNEYKLKNFFKEAWVFTME